MQNKISIYSVPNEAGPQATKRYKVNKNLKLFIYEDTSS